MLSNKRITSNLKETGCHGSLEKKKSHREPWRTCEERRQSLSLTRGRTRVAPLLTGAPPASWCVTQVRSGVALCVPGRRVSRGALCLVVVVRRVVVVPVAVLAVLLAVVVLAAVPVWGASVVVIVAPVLLIWRPCLV